MKKPSLADLLGSSSGSKKSEVEPDEGNTEEISEEGSPEAVFSEMMDTNRSNQERLRSFQALVRSEFTKLNSG